MMLQLHFSFQVILCLTYRTFYIYLWWRRVNRERPRCHMVMLRGWSVDTGKRLPLFVGEG